MKQKKKDAWISRLAHADRYWEEQGLTGKGGKGIDAMKYVEWYRGNQWPMYGWGGARFEDLVTCNVMFSNTNQMVSRLSKRNPEPVVTARKKGSEESARARRNQIVLSYAVDEIKMKREVDRALLDAAIGPFGFVLHGFTAHIEKFDSDGKEIETYQMAKPEWPFVRRKPWWDVRIDPLADNWHPDHTATWFAHRELLSMEQIENHPRLKVPKNFKPTKKVDLLEQGRNITDDRGKEWYELAECWWVYDKTDRTFFCISPGSEDLLMEPEDWTIPWEGLPYSYLAFNPQIDSNVPLPFPKAYESQQVELNKTRTLMAELVKRTRRIVLAQRNAFSDADAKRIEAGELALQEIFLVDGSLQDALGQVPVGGLDQQLLLYAASIKEDIREAMGISNMDRAQRVNVESAFEAQQIQSGSDSLASRPQEAFEAFWADILRRFHQSLRYTMTEDVLVPVVGLADMEALKESGDFITVSREDVDGEFGIKIRVGSTLPENHEMNFAKALQLKTTLVDDPTADQVELTRVMVEEAGFDSTRLVRSPQQVATAQGILNQQGLGGGEGGGAKKASGNTGGLDANVVRLLGGNK